MTSDRGLCRITFMGKLLRLRDKFLIGLALAGDIIIPALIRAGRGLPPYKL